MTKKTVFFVSGILGGGVLLLDFIGTYALCDYFINSGHKGNCPFLLSDTLLTLSPFIIVFFFSFLTLFLRDEVFGSWWKFVRVALPLAIFAIFLSPSYSNDWMYPIEKGTVATFAFLALSLGSIFVFLRTVFRKQ